MSKTVDIVVINSLNVSVCEDALKIAEEFRNVLHLICGGLGECLEYVDLVDRVYGVPNVYDDDHIIKEFKKKNIFVSGRWVAVDGICITGIDSKNPMQSVNKILTQSIDNHCEMSLVLSTYPMAISKCSKINFRGRGLTVGLPIEVSKMMLSVGKGLRIIIACSEYLQNFCIDRLGDDILYISIPNSINISLISVDVSKRIVLDIRVLKEGP
jgi:hypothetical protein